MASLAKQLRTDDAFVVALQAHDAEAWTNFIDEYSVMLYNYLRYNLPTDESVEDIWNEIVLAVVHSIGDFPQEMSLSTWVYSIAYRKVANYWRQQKYPDDIAGSETPNPTFRSLMAGLPELAQQALLLRYYVGMSVAEIAEILGRSLKATESLLQRARQQLHEAEQIDLASVLPTEPADENTGPSARAIFGATYPLLVLQKQLCQQNGMTAEAAIFDRAQQQLEQLATISAGDFLAELQKIEELLLGNDPTQLIELLSKTLSRTR